MKKKDFDSKNYNFSDCREITGDELYQINGGERVENSNEGVYYEESIAITAITAGEVAEFVYNTPIFIMNQIFSNSGMNKFVKFDYIELDGK